MRTSQTAGRPLLWLTVDDTQAAVVAFYAVPARSDASLEFPSNPFAILTFISAPAVLTNASCVLLFGTGNRYGRAIDRMHELYEAVESGSRLDEVELKLKIRQLEAGATRTTLIVTALTCFYTAVAGFVTSTLISLIGAIMVSMQMQQGVPLAFALAFIAGAIGVAAMITGAIMLARESRFSLNILREEKSFITERIRQRMASLGDAASTHSTQKESIV